MEFKTAYGPKKRVQYESERPSMTKQSFVQETNVNFIISKYRKTGMLEHVNNHQGSYGEYQTIDFQEAMEAVRAAEGMFSTLPADVRKRFRNDPAAFLEFVDDPQNLDEMRTLGLLPAKPEPPAEPPPAPAPQPSTPAEG